MVSYQYALREHRARRSLERELHQEIYDAEMGKAYVDYRSEVESESKWRKMGYGFYVVGCAIAIIGAGIWAFLKWCGRISRTQPIQDGSTTKQFKGIVGQIDDFERSSFVRVNSFRLKRR